MRWKGGERNSKEGTDIEIEQRKIFETLSEEGIERYMKMRKGELSGDGKKERYIEMTKMKKRSQANGDNYKDKKKK